MKLPFRGGTPKPDRTPDAVMTLTEHLAELRVRIIRCALAVTIGMVLIMAFYNQVLRFLSRPYKALCQDDPSLCPAGAFDGHNPQFLNLDPIGGLGTRVRVAMYGGLVLAIPVIMWQLWKFIVPALKSNEKKYAIPFIVSSVSLFVLGGFLAYWTLEAALEFLISWAGEDVTSNFEVGRYVNLVVLMVGAFGVGFQFPVLLVFLQLVGVLSPKQLISWWRYALVGIVVLAAVITPSGDPISLAALALPMTVLYFASIGIGFIAQRRAARSDQPATAA
ncbi:twin-arginine translocase subunit TatC [Desertimonas flava]|jgi:sec-independent protein translocase protein TatC|uniref:twin-arginine translocase subunit TatC n=1 Tax=Desertimonas flava TaxID=2064846 RepID=UPI000E357881|nr:twin-arginine translocase subunit TatC [Desertimonas flava]